MAKKSTSADEDLNPKKRGLGRGLDALFGSGEEIDGMDGTPGPVSRKTVGIEQLSPNPLQPRKRFEDESLEELSGSIRNLGLLQPLLVRPVDSQSNETAEHYEIIAGERRYRAAQKAGLHELPVMIRSLSDSEALQVGLVENLQREDLNAIEEAEGYHHLIETHGHTPSKVGGLVGKSRSHVANMMRLLSLPQDVQDLLRQGRLSMGQARALLSLENPSEIAARVVKEGLSVRQVETLAKQAANKSGTQRSGKTQAELDADKTIYRAMDANTLALEKEISEALGMKAELKMHKSHTSGQLNLTFRSLDQLDFLLQRLMR